MLMLPSFCDPDFVETLKVRFESCNRIVGVDVVLLELLNDHEDEQIQHDVLHYQYEHKKESH
jgi:hypothetical protein